MMAANHASIFHIVHNGDRAIDIVFASPRSATLTESIHRLSIACHAQLSAIVSEIIPAYQCLTLQFKKETALDTEIFEQVEQLAQHVLANPTDYPLAKSTQIEIPVCYSDQFAIDKNFVSAHCQLDWQEIVQRHSQPEYRVAMLGFSPGFMYLEGLEQSLYCPRKENPEKYLAAGSVGIGGSQTGIYPQSSPGGWQIIGRTPLPLFLPENPYPCLAKALDTIRFVAISEQQFADLESEFRINTDRQYRLPSSGETESGSRHYKALHWRDCLL